MTDIVTNCHNNYSEDFCRYTIYCITKALNDMHRGGVIHGDVCAENVHCDPEGAIKLVNIGTAFDPQKLVAYQNARRVMCNWQAPEVIKGSAYSK